MKRIFLLTPAVLGLFLTSCVSNKKYNEVTTSLAVARKQISDLNENIDNLKDRLELMEAANSSAAQEIDAKNATLLAKQSELESNAQLLAEQQERLRNLQALIDKQKEQSAALRHKMAEALKGFSSDQLTVTQKDGKVYVSMQESLLFPSGSAAVNKEGRNALAKLAEVLNTNNDININVEGHTDSIPIKLKFEDNWALSVARATSIVRILINDYGVSPLRMTASGRSEYLPIATNEHAEGRAKNRRTEIILEPKLDALMDILQGN
jgi:chemotaxis protein MotB